MRNCSVYSRDLIFVPDIGIKVDIYPAKLSGPQGLTTTRLV